MAIHVALDHLTEYQYDRPVRLSPHDIRLHPAPHSRTPVHDYRLEIEPRAHQLHWQEDPFGNVIARAFFPEPVTELSIRVRLVADMTVINPFDFFVEKYAETYPFTYDALLKHELAPYFEKVESGPALMKWLARESRKPCHIVDFLVDLNARVRERVGYTVRLDPGVQTCEETFERGTGSCRDSGWLLVQLLRHLGLAARFVSGYLGAAKAPTRKRSTDRPAPSATSPICTRGPKCTCRARAGSASMPTSGLFAGEGHIPLACTPDPISAAPLTGFTDECEIDVRARQSRHARARRSRASPSLTPTSSGSAIRRARAHGRSRARRARRAPDRRRRADVRRRSTTWKAPSGTPRRSARTSAACRRARSSACSTRSRPAASALRARQVVSGRAAAALGAGVLLAQRRRAAVARRQTAAPTRQRDYGFDAAHAERFGRGCRCAWASLPRSSQALEDALHYLWEAKLPLTTARPRRLTTSMTGRARRLALASRAGLDTARASRCRSLGSRLRALADAGHWQFARGAMYLMPGSSPMGLRLPLDALPLDARTSERRTRSPFEPRAGSRSTQPSVSPLMAARRPRRAGATAGSSGPRHAALCVETRGGRLYVFMPLLAVARALHSTCRRRSSAPPRSSACRVLIEGYEPPRDRRSCTRSRSRPTPA